jgi:hypothetical protein
MFNNVGWQLGSDLVDKKFKQETIKNRMISLFQSFPNSFLVK